MILPFKALKAKSHALLLCSLNHTLLQVRLSIGPSLSCKGQVVNQSFGNLLSPKDLFIFLIKKSVSCL